MKTIIFLITLLMHSLSWSANMEDAIHQLQKQWAIANYETVEDKYQQVFESLNKKAEDVVSQFPNKAEPLIWQAIILSTDAGKNGGFGALGKVKQAKELLLQAEKINPNALNGSIYTSLGSLYYQVPGWPIGFGDNDQAKIYLNKALKANPNGIDANYFYADYLLEVGLYQQAITQFNKALNAPLRPKRPLADKGRRLEIKNKLTLAESKI